MTDTMRVSLSELNFRLGNLLPAGKAIRAVRPSQDGLSIECELGNSPDNRHTYRPHKKYPWFCGVCGYPEHERLKHR